MAARVGWRLVPNDPRDDYLTFSQFVTDKFRVLVLILALTLS